MSRRFDDDRGAKRPRWEGDFNHRQPHPHPNSWHSNQPRYNSTHQYPHPQPRSPYYSHQEPSPSPSTGPSHLRAPGGPDAPSASVVLLGLPPACTDEQLRAFLEEMGSSIDETTVIIDRATGLSKRYGFAKFSSVEHARAFVEPNFPTVKWRERGMNGRGKDDGMVIKINYSQKTGGWRDDQGAGARLTDDQRQDEPPRAYVNDGTRDIGTSSTQIILLRNLDPLSTENDVHAALSSIPSRVGDDVRLRGGVKRVYIARDRGSRSSCGFAFVQLSDVKLATDVLSQVHNSRVFPGGFKVRQSAVTASFSHPNSFLPVYKKSDWSFAAEGGQELVYWDDKLFVSVWKAAQPAAHSAPPSPAKKAPASTAPPSQAASTAAANGDDDDMDDFFASLDADHPVEPDTELGVIPGLTTLAPTVAAEPKPAEPSAPAQPKTLVIKSLVGTSAEERIKAMAQPAAQAAAAAAKDAVAAPAEPIALLTEKKKGSGELIYSRKAAPNIAKWNVKAQELKQPDTIPQPQTLSSSNAAAPASTSTPEAGPSSIATTNPSDTVAGDAKPEKEEDADPFPYADAVKFVCLLCQRQFKSVPELEKHNRLSQLHKTNLASPDSLAACAARKASLQPHPRNSSATPADSPATPTEPSGPKYVDRAAARREAFHQPDEPPRGAKKRKVFEGPPPPNVPVSAVVEEIEENNVGRGMLEKMGWTKGVGLGAGGTGRVDPVAAAQYHKGVGLGASKAVMVGSPSPDVPSTHGEILRDKARARMAENERNSSQQP